MLKVAPRMRRPSLSFYSINVDQTPELVPDRGFDQGAPDRLGNIGGKARLPPCFNHLGHHFFDTFRVAHLVARGFELRRPLDIGLPHRQKHYQPRVQGVDRLPSSAMEPQVWGVFRGTSFCIAALL